MTIPTPAATWYLEDLPARQLTGAPPHPGMTDEDHAVSAPYALYENTTEDQARKELIIHLIQSRSLLVRYPWLDQAHLYDAAVAAVKGGANLVHVVNRVYRLRDVTLCTPAVPNGVIPHHTHQNCPACTPTPESTPTFTDDALTTTPITPEQPSAFPSQRTEDTTS